MHIAFWQCLESFPQILNVRGQLFSGAKTYKKGGWLVIWSNEHLGTYKSHNITI